MFKKRQAKSFRKRDAGEADIEQQADPTTVTVKRPKVESGLLYSNNLNGGAKEGARVVFESSRTLQQSDDYRDNALVVEDEQEKRERMLKEEQMQRSADPNLQVEGTYKGQHQYVDYRQGFRREANLSGNKATGVHGPIRATAAIRVTARFDYQPDLCKDYKETGYCGYGDNCKFLHDRSEYKAGWQIEKEWEDKQKKDKEKAEKGGEGHVDDARGDKDENGLPFACLQCRTPWLKLEGDPLATLCGHYFCQSCALSQRKPGKKRQKFTCPICNQNTQGIYNTAWDIIKQKEASVKQSSEKIQKDQQDEG